VAELTIRPATPEDESAVLGLVEELFTPPGRRPADYTRERGATGFRHAVHGPDADILLALDDGTVVGFASVYADFPSIRFGLRCWLEDLVVAGPHRGRGIGRCLLDAATSWARARGCTHLELDSAAERTDAHRFYLANGMEQRSLVFSRRIGVTER
jgi:GNAT superfamily N-acetyltransferase